MSEDRLGSLQEILGSRDEEIAGLEQGLRQDMLTATQAPDALDAVPDLQSAIVRALGVGLPALLARGVGGKVRGGAAASSGLKTLDDFDEFDKKKAGQKQRQAAAEAQLKREELKEARRSKNRTREAIESIPIDVEKAEQIDKATFDSKEKLQRMRNQARLLEAQVAARASMTTAQATDYARIEDRMKGDFDARDDLIRKINLIGGVNTALKSKSDIALASVKRNLIRVFGESSRLTREDVLDAAPNTAKGTATSIVNWVTGKTSDPLTDEQRAAIREMVVRKSTEIRKTMDRIGNSHFKRSSGYSPLLGDKIRKDAIENFLNPLKLSLDDSAVMIGLIKNKKTGKEERWRGFQFLDRNDNVQFRKLELLPDIGEDD